MRVYELVSDYNDLARQKYPEYYEYFENKGFTPYQKQVIYKSIEQDRKHTSDISEQDREREKWANPKIPHTVMRVISEDPPGQERDARINNVLEAIKELEAKNETSGNNQVELIQIYKSPTSPRNESVEKLKEINKFPFDINGKLLPFEAQWSKFISENHKEEALLIVSEKTESLGLPNIDNLDLKKPLIMTAKVATKIVTKHHLSHDIKELPEQLRKSPLFMESISDKNSENSLVAVLDKKNKSQETLIAVISFDKKIGSIHVDRLSSVYGKHNLQNLINRTLNGNKKMFETQYTKNWNRYAGLQLPNGRSQQDNFIPFETNNQINSTQENKSILVDQQLNPKSVLTDNNINSQSERNDKMAENENTYELDDWDRFVDSNATRKSLYSDEVQIYQDRGFDEYQWNAILTSIDVAHDYDDVEESSKERELWADPRIPGSAMWYIASEEPGPEKEAKTQAVLNAIPELEKANVKGDKLSDELIKIYKQVPNTSEISSTDQLPPKSVLTDSNINSQSERNDKMAENENAPVQPDNENEVGADVAESTSNATAEEANVTKEQVNWKVRLAGNPEVLNTRDGKSQFVKIRAAHNSYEKAQDGQLVQSGTDFIDLRINQNKKHLFTMGRLSQKGDPLIVQGELQTYQGKSQKTGKEYTAQTLYANSIGLDYAQKPPERLAAAFGLPQVAQERVQGLSNSEVQQEQELGESFEQEFGVEEGQELS
jgi:single-stranded DNA-binding protein